MGYQDWEHCPDPIYRTIKIYLKFTHILKSYVYLAITSGDFFIVPGLCLLVEANALSVTISGHPTDTSSILLTGTMLFQNFTFK